MPKKTLEETQEEAPVIELCGHVDQHSFGPDNKPDRPTCDLPAGHTGDHHALHKQKVEIDRIYERETGKLLKIEYEVVDLDAYWNDAASVPAKDVKIEKLPNRSKKSEIMQMVEQLMA